MRAILRSVAALGTALALAACSPAAVATIPPAAPGATSGTGATSGATTTATSSRAAPCANTTEPTTVSATVADRTWAPVSAKVGDVITWTNADPAPHAVALDDGSCVMSGSIPGNGGTKSLVFSIAGSFPFHCSVHPSMKGTITIS